MNKIHKITIFTTIFLLISTSFTVSVPLENENIIDKKANLTTATCYLFKPEGLTTIENDISYETGSQLIELFQNSNSDPSKRTELYKKLNDLGFIQEEYLNFKKDFPLNNWNPLQFTSTGSSFFSSILSGGSGRIFPLVIGPRPRAILLWEGAEVHNISVTIVGSLTQNKGFKITGNQRGIAIGFAGVGLTYGTPFGPVYALSGNSVFCSFSANDIVFFPPNSKPTISSPNPSNGEENVPLTLSELSFGIDDADNDLISFTVSTDPYIGSGEGTNKGNGFYSVPVNGLQQSTTYTWTVSVSDGKDTTENTYHFTTIKEEPVVSNPSPRDGVSVSDSLDKLEFDLYDAQGDPMDFTVETSPNIGQGSRTGVSNGRYSISVENLQIDTWYSWYVNVTDGTHWTYEKYRFYVGELNLVGYWSFDENEGNKAYDSSDYNNHGSIHGASWIQGVSGSALKFDGSNDYIGISNDASLNFADTNQFTISIWIKTDNTQDTNIISKGLTLSPHRGYNLGLYDNNTLALSIGNGEYTNRLKTGRDVVDGLWHHIIAQWDGQIASMYIDDQLIRSHYVNNFNIADLTDDMRIGKHYDKYFNGCIDEVKIYDMAIDPNELI